MYAIFDLERFTRFTVAKFTSKVDHSRSSIMIHYCFRFPVMFYKILSSAYELRAYITDRDCI